MRIWFSSILLSVCLLNPAFAGLLDEARVLLNKDKPNQAMSKVNTYLKTQPNDPDGRFLKGYILQHMGDIDAATKVYVSLTKDFPTLPEPYNNLATIHASKGDIERAKSSLLSALKTHPGYSKIYTNLSEVYARQASDAYQQALGIDKLHEDTSVIRIPSFSALSQPGSNKVTTATISKPPIVVATIKTVETPKTKSAPVLSTEVLSNEEVAKIRLTVSDWAEAWSSQDTEDYLSYYASFFKPKSGSIAEWKQQRSKRLTEPKFIRVLLGDMTLKPFAKDSVKIEMVQHYQSDTYKDVSNKRIYLNRNAKGEWKIYREYSI